MVAVGKLMLIFKIPFDHIKGKGSVIGFILLPYLKILIFLSLKVSLDLFRFYALFRTEENIISPETVTKYKYYHLELEK